MLLNGDWTSILVPLLYRQPKIQKAVTETELFPPGL